MHQSILKLENIINLEREIYEEIFYIEENKTEAIMNRDGKAITELSSIQEKFISKIESLEKERETVMADYKKFKRLYIYGGDYTLQDVIDTLSGEYAIKIKETGADLKKVLLKIKDVQDVNSQLLNDNMEFYDILISGLKSSSTLKSGYDRDGKENGRVFNPVLFNTKA